MKRFLALTLMLTLLCSCALADDLSDSAIANGNVTAVNFVDVVAPYSGTLGSFDLAMGDTVEAGDPLFTLLTTTVYAPESGTVTALFAAEGDDASAVMSRYGALAAIEPEQELLIAASTSGAYDKNENKLIHMGETLYFRSSKGDKEEGSGRVIAVSDGNYVVEILEGDFDLKESLTLYRDDSYGSKDNVGKGTVTRRDPVTVQGQGRVAELLVGEGDAVTVGQPLLTLMSPDADADAQPTVTAPATGVVASVAVAAGQQVWKGQLLARLYLTDAMEVLVDVDEMDLANLRVGDRLSLTLDMDEGSVITGTVTEISALGVTKQNAAYYTVHVSIPADRALLGASVSVYIPQD